MGLRSTVLASGAVAGIIYDFERAGDDLAAHVHALETNHISIVARGSFRLVGDPAIAGKVLPTGSVVLWPVGQAHGFVAFEDRSRIVQIATAGKTDE